MKRKNQKNSFFQDGPKGLVVAVVLVVICMIALQKLVEFTGEIKNFTYTEFQKNVEQGHVKTVVVTGQDVQGTLQDGGHFHTIIPQNPNDWDLLKLHAVNVTIADAAGQMSLLYMLMIALLFIGLAVFYFFRQARNAQGGGGNGGANIFNMGKSRAKLFMPSSIKENFDSVAGAAEAKEELKDVVDFLKNPEKYRRLGAQMTRGVLLVGEPGNGKTLLAKAVAGEATCPFFSISGSDFIEVFVGVGASRVRDLFAQARKHAPSIVFIDEIDIVGAHRGNSQGSGNEEREQTLNQLLTEMDGFQTTGGAVMVLAATNRPDILDKALLRPGRFDRRVEVPYPDLKSREEILKVHIRDVKLADDVDLAELASSTAGFSGADLRNLLNEAAINASKANQETITLKNFEDARTRIMRGATIVNLGRSKARLFMPSSIKENFSSVAGAAEAKEELRDVVDFLKDPEKYHRLGAQMLHGILLVGEPGNGKTLLAKAVAGEAVCPFFSISGSDFVEMFVGVGAARVRELFDQARKHAPSIIFIDEIDAVGSSRGGKFDSGESDRTLNQLLTEMDGFQAAGSPVIVIATTNRPDVLDKALLRPGRFDRKVVVPYPDLKSREEILKVHAREVKLSPDVDLGKIARGTPGFSGADLKNIINEAAINASKTNQESITIQDFEEARDRIMLGKEVKTMTQSKQELELTAYHESGHALVSLMLPEHSDPLHKITIIPRGRALGVTHSLPEKEKYTTTQEELLANIKMCLGGRAAEQLVFNKVTTGAYSDFVSATNTARTMVCSYGMSKELGSVIYNQGGSFEYSQKTAERIDAEVQRILDECARETMQLLIDNREKLNLLATTLLEKETLFAGEIYELLGITAREEHKFT